MLLILLSAYAGKVLHTHPEAYYRNLFAASSDTSSSSLKDDCAICHFQFYSCLTASVWHLCSEFLLLTTFRPTEKSTPDKTEVVHARLRAPPSKR